MTRTVVIIDRIHNGTTMLAGVLVHLGVPMWGENYRVPKLEDTDMIAAIRKGESYFAQLVAQRNTNHEIWGFKFPPVWRHYMPLLQRQLSDPVYLAIYKDPVSVAQRHANVGQAPSLEQVRDEALWTLRNINGMLDRGVHVFPLSYVRAVVRPSEFVELVAEIVGIEPTAEQAERAIEWIQPNKGAPRAPYPRLMR